MPVVRKAILGGVFLVPGLLHVVDPGQFAWQIYQYGILDEDASAIIAMPLALLELWLGASFLLDRASWSLYFLAAALLVCFLVAISVVLLNDRRVTCGCLGVYSPELSWMHAAAVALLAFVYSRMGVGHRRSKPAAEFAVS